MRVYYLSDLHIERGIVSLDDFTFNLSTETKNILALCGDIGDPFSQLYWDLIFKMSKMFHLVFILTGNHEYYGHNMQDVDNHIMYNIHNFPNVKFLNNSVYEVEGIKFVGSTLWSNVPDDQKEFITGYMNDYRLIQDFTVDWQNQLHEENVSFLTQEIDTNTVVLTHHAPDRLNTSAKKYRNTPSTYAFGTDLDDLVAKCKYWIYGHTHYNIDHEKLKTNQHGGYENTMHKFEMSKYIEINRSVETKRRQLVVIKDSKRQRL